MVARAAVVVALVVVAAAGGVASAQRAVDPAEREYRLGYAALQAGDCAKAIVHYRRSFELTPRPRTLFNMAACEEELGLYADAWRSYHAFLALAEARDAEIVVTAKARIAALRDVLRGKVTVTSSPSGASVHVNGERQARGVTPLTLALEPGAHTIRVSRRDAAPVERRIDVAPDHAETVAVTLAPPATITIVADPPDAVIVPDHGAPGGGAVTGRYEAAVAAGRHAFTVQRDGYEAERVEIDARAGDHHNERVRLRPLAGGASLIVAGVPGAQIRIDGAIAPASTLPSGALELRALPAGSHEIRVTADGHKAWRDTLHLSSGEVVTVELDAPRASPRRRVAGWTLGGLGVAGIVGGGVVGVVALRDVTGPPGPDRDRGKQRALVADGLFVVGAAAVVTAWRLLRGQSPRATISRTFEEAR